MALILPYNSKEPKIASNAYIAPNATIIGDVTIEEGASIWFNVVIRGDFQPIVIGKYTNIQDNSTVHVMGDSPTIIGDFVTVGHNCVVHCDHVGNNTLIGMGAVLLGYTTIGENSIVGAGSLLTQHKKIPRNSYLYGRPAKLIRSIRDDEREALCATAVRHHELSIEYLKEH